MNLKRFAIIRLFISLIVAIVQFSPVSYFTQDQYQISDALGFSSLTNPIPGTLENPYEKSIASEKNILPYGLQNTPLYQWHTFFGAANDDDTPYSIATDYAGGVYITGYSDMSWNGPEGQPPLHEFSSREWADLFVLKLSANGIYQWHTFYSAPYESGGQETYAQGISVDNNMGVYITGFSWGAWNGPEGQMPLHQMSGLEDTFILKLNYDGVYQWHTFFGSSDVGDEGRGIAVDNNDGVYITGSSDYSWNGPEGQPPLHEFIYGSTFILKLSRDGEYQWHTFYELINDKSIAVDYMGGVYISGFSELSWNGPRGQMQLYNPSGLSNMVLLKLSTDGNYQWHTFFPSEGNCHCAMVLDEDRGVYILSWSLVNWFGPDGQPPLHAHSGGDNVNNLAVLKLSTNGIYQWHTFFPAEARSIEVDTIGGVYVTGWNSVSWDGPDGESPIHPFSGSSNLFLLKLSSEGSYQWHTFYGSITGALDLSIDPGNNIYIAGNSSDTWNGDNNTPPQHDFSGNGPDIFILKLWDSNCKIDIDTDCDGLLNDWEINGFDYNGDGKVDVDLPAMGADPYVKDIFVEIDYLVKYKKDGTLDHTHQPNSEAIDRVVQAFARQGIHLHVDWGPLAKLTWGNAPIWGSFSEGEKLVEYKDELNAPNEPWDDWRNWPGFDNIKITQGHFKPERAPIFHYVIFTHNLGGTIKGKPATDYRGYSRNDIYNGWDVFRHGGASDFVIALGQEANKEGTPTNQASAFMHELGHNLGLHHGGYEPVDFKPNYLSVMNSSFGLSGLIYDKSAGYVDYSAFDNTSIPPLNEQHLDERYGLHGTGIDIFGTRWYCNILGIWIPKRSDEVNKTINWNCSLSPEGEPDVQADINKSGSNTDMFSTFYDWPMLVYDMGIIGDIIGKPKNIDTYSQQLALDEITLDERFPENPEPYAISLDPSINSVVSRGIDTTMPITLTNLGYLTATVSLSTSVVPSWFDISSIPISVTLTSGSTSSFPISFTIPDTVVSGDVQTMTLQASLKGAPLMGDEIDISVRIGPMAWFEAEPVQGNPPHNVNFSDQSIGIISNWLWDFGDGSTSTEQNPIHSYTKPGIYSVSLTITGYSGHDTYTRNDLVRITLPKMLFLPVVIK